MARSTWSWIGVASLTLAACGGATPLPETAARAPASPKTSQPSKPAVAEARAEPEAGSDAQAEDDGLPPGVLRLSPGDTGDPNNGRLRVAPAPLDLASLPSVEVPAPLEPKDAPRALPTSKAVPSLKIEKIDSGWRARGAEGSAVYVVLDEKLGRIQIGTIDPNRNATDRVYRTCGDRYYQQAMLTPARWQTLTRQDGRTKLTIVDAWFDARSCKASVVRQTEVEPKPVLGSLLYAFRSPCEHCVAGERVTFIAPPLTQVAAEGVGGEATISHGSFALVELPLRRGGAASFAGQVPAHALTTWSKALGLEDSERADVTMGVELQQAVGDERPLGIAYATLMTR
jgi:hypothetical protein